MKQWQKFQNLYRNWQCSGGRQCLKVTSLYAIMILLWDQLKNHTVKWVKKRLFWPTSKNFFSGGIQVKERNPPVRTSHRMIRLGFALSVHTVDLQHMFGASTVVELVNVLSDDHHGAALLAEPCLTLGDGIMRCVGALAQCYLPPMVVELPDTGWIPRKSFWSG